MNTQLVCETQPVCRCTGADGSGEYDGYSCDCVADERTGVCVHCREPMVVIDADTGAVMGSGVVN
jgi:hypothetical protein